MLLVATGNAHKTQEIAAILGSEWKVEDLRAHPQLSSPEENGTTFEANARIKAESASRELPGVLVLSDDSGLEVDALGGAPGVISARYAGPSATDADNRERVKRELAGRESTARFHCCMVLARGGQTLGVFNGAVEGRILITEHGSGGFGYDPLFVPDGYTETFGVLPGAVKNQLSHRARALSQVTEWLKTNP
ncbi:MAG: RdgB/HAM1 family non-canonical purine NTP pyrophosphatase [Verrucomicrobiaceae bacterium]|nr:RdgB/HAM1 family non-canonical purine NTP pyrophosphatase [Verrucomicrobiaceae bacterium]